MFTIVLCDDNRIFLNQLKDYIETYLASKGLIGKVYAFSDPLIFWSDAQENIDRYDLFIIDLEMPQLSGDVLAQKIKDKKKNACIILLTSHSEYVLDAFELEIFRFIPKDNCKRRLSKAIDVAAYRAINSQNKYYVYHSREGDQKIFYNDIIYIAKDEKNSIIMTNTTGAKAVRISMADLFKELESDEFIFISRSNIVNINHIVKILNEDGHYAVLKNGEKLDISKAKVKEVVRSINHNWSKKI